MWFDKAAEWDRWCTDGSNWGPEIESRAGEWPSYLERTTKQTTDTCSSSDNISRRAPPLRTGLSILVPQTVRAAWAWSTAASGRIGFMKRTLYFLLLSQQGQFLLSAVLTNNVCRRRLFCLKLFGAGCLQPFCGEAAHTGGADTKARSCLLSPVHGSHVGMLCWPHSPPVWLREASFLCWRGGLVQNTLCLVVNVVCRQVSVWALMGCTIVMGFYIGR